VTIFVSLHWTIVKLAVQHTASELRCLQKYSTRCLFWDCWTSAHNV